MHLLNISVTPNNTHNTQFIIIFFNLKKMPYTILSSLSNFSTFNEFEISIGMVKNK